MFKAVSGGVSVTSYEAFVRVTETGSFTKAAKSMGYTQSAVSQMIKTIEDELGTTLIRRSKKGIEIQGNQAIFSLIGQIQEETHRFAIEFHRQQQNQRVRGSVLDQIPGVGEKRRAELLKAFKSIKNIKSATLAELEDAVPKNTARAVYDFFHQKGEEPSCE